MTQHIPYTLELAEEHAKVDIAHLPISKEQRYNKSLRLVPRLVLGGCGLSTI